MAEMMGGAGGGWMDYLRRFANSQGGTGQGIGAAIGSENSESMGRMYDQLIKPPAPQPRPMAAPPAIAMTAAPPINFSLGAPGGVSPQMMQMLIQILKSQRG